MHVLLLCAVLAADQRLSLCACPECGCCSGCCGAKAGAGCSALDGGNGGQTVRTVSPPPAPTKKEADLTIGFLFPERTEALVGEAITEARRLSQWAAVVTTAMVAVCVFLLAGAVLRRRK